MRVLYFQFLVVAAVFGAIAWVAAGRGGGLADPRQDRPEPALADDRRLGRDDIDGTRFAVSFRGYRMDQVDRMLDRLAAEIAERDRLIADLTRPAAGRFGEGAVSYEPVARPYDLAQGAQGAQGVLPGAEGVTATATTLASAAATDQPAPEQTLPNQDPAGDNPLAGWYRQPEDEQ